MLGVTVYEPRYLLYTASNMYATTLVCVLTRLNYPNRFVPKLLAKVNELRIIHSFGNVKG